MSHEFLHWHLITISDFSPREGNSGIKEYFSRYIKKVQIYSVSSMKEGGASKKKVSSMSLPITLNI